MERFDTLGTISRLIVTGVLKSHLASYPTLVNRDAYSGRELSCHPWRRPIQPPERHFDDYASNDHPRVSFGGFHHHLVGG